jgi:hypothetical protein
VPSANSVPSAAGVAAGSRCCRRSIKWWKQLQGRLSGGSSSGPSAPSAVSVPSAAGRAAHDVMSVTWLGKSVVSGFINLARLLAPLHHLHQVHHLQQVLQQVSQQVLKQVLQRALQMHCSTHNTRRCQQSQGSLSRVC